jgi:hypothetical protein
MDFDKKKLAKDAGNWKLKLADKTNENDLLNKKCDGYRREIRLLEKSV